jgi:hypothetical protein
VKATLLAVALVMAGGDFPAADEYRPPSFRATPVQMDDGDDSDIIWQPDRPAKRKKKRQPTLWLLRIEGEKQTYLVPIAAMKKMGFKAGVTVSPETARLLAVELGAKYPPEILEKLEKLK